MVTRTVKTTEVNILCLNIETAEPQNKLYKLIGKYEDEDKILAKATEIEKDALSQLRPVTVVDAKHNQTLYGMSEEDFVANAVDMKAEPFAGGENEEGEQA